MAMTIAATAPICHTGRPEQRLDEETGAADADAQERIESPDWSFLPSMSEIASTSDYAAIEPDPRPTLERAETVLEMLSRTRPRYVHRPREPKPWHPQDERIAAEKRQAELRRQREAYESKRPIVAPLGYREIEEFPGITTYVSERTGRRYTVYDIRRGTLDPVFPAADFPTARVQGRGVRGAIKAFVTAALRFGTWLRPRAWPGYRRRRDGRGGPVG